MPTRRGSSASRLGIPADKIDGFAAIAQALFKAYVDEDATLAEINPLILHRRRRLAGARLQDRPSTTTRSSAIPDEALRDMAEENETELEARALRDLLCQARWQYRLHRQWRRPGDGDDGRGQA